ncbi:MAG: tyrosine-type recombinase/integrase [Synergistaceae bacterium]|nr:tyrosine-type recombinase/integrase [Synergistaceae bacterium]MBR0251625.1 tyrosine-type recombinase/integrase [Synergistaceae bacterium]
MTTLTRAVNNTPAIRTFGIDLLNDFYSFLDVSPKTLSTYQRAMRQVFGYFKEHGINQPTHQDVVNFKKALEAKGRKPATISLYLAACRRFFTWTEQAGIFPNVAKGIKAPRQERGHKRDFFGASQLKGIMSDMSRDTLQGKRDYAVFALMATCGLRTIEIARANIEDIRNLGGEMILYVQGKGRRDRTEFVKLPERLLQAINEYLNARGKAPDNAPLFAGIGNRNHNGRMTTRTISRIAKNAMRHAGYDNRRLTAHSLRHSAVTLSLLGGMNLADVQAFARHSNISTTQIYSHAVDRIRSMCEDIIANAIF